MHFTILFPALMMFSSAYAAPSPTPPAFPFTGWQNLQDGSMESSATSHYCQANNTFPVVHYVIHRTDGFWELYAPIHPEQSERWLAFWMPSLNAIPTFTYFGVTHGNTIEFQSVVPWNTAAHNGKVCPLLFENR